MISEHQIIDEYRKTTIPNHKIRDSQSFNNVTGGRRQVAGLYFYLMLDCLVDLAYKVSQDFFKRPHLYTDLGKCHINQMEEVAIAPTLAKLGARYGSDERIPSKEQRDQIYIPLFGQTGSTIVPAQEDFPRLRDALIHAATAFAERVFDTGEDMLRESVRTAHRPVKEYLTGLQGDSVKWSREQALSELTEKISYPILRNKGVAAIFGISRVPKMEWPYDEDSNGDKLVEEISKQQRWMDQSEMYITRERISNLQRTALRGAEAIATIIDFDERGTDGDLDLLITKLLHLGFCSHKHQASFC